MSTAWFFAAVVNWAFVLSADRLLLVRVLLMSVCSSVTKVLFSWTVHCAEPLGAEFVAAAVLAGAEVACPAARVGVTGVDEGESVAVAVTRLTGTCRI